VLAGIVALLACWTSEALAGGQWRFGINKKSGESSPCWDDEHGGYSELGGSWYWMRSPDEEKRHVTGLYIRYCVRCHGADGRGIWDIPDVPNFTNARWQASRPDAQIARIIIEGRGAVMPPFRGAISLEESWAIARHLRTFVPGTEVSRPDLGTPEKPMKLPVNDKMVK
jgi:hypothetical protein